MSNPLRRQKEDAHEYRMPPAGIPLSAPSWQTINPIYNQNSTNSSQIPPYPTFSAHPSGQQPWTMEPGQQIPEYQAQNAHYGTFPQQTNLSYPMHDSTPQHSSQLPISSVYPPAASGGAYAPSPYNTALVPPQLFSAHSHTSGSPPIPHTTTIVDPNLPEDVQQAMQAAYDSVEWANGDNVPAEILMPTVKKLGRDSWECRICHKEHKRRDHTLTHVRTAHLDNKGFRCTFENCDSAFGRKGDLERHVSSTHQASFSDTCPYCQSQLHRKDNLSRHIRSCKKAPQGAAYQQGYTEHPSQYNTSDQVASSSRSRRNDDYN